MRHYAKLYVAKPYLATAWSLFICWSVVCHVTSKRAAFLSC